MKCEQLVSFVICFYLAALWCDKVLNCPAVTALLAKPYPKGEGREKSLLHKIKAVVIEVSHYYF